jgi:hypothetical protein
MACETRAGKRKCLPSTGAVSRKLRHRQETSLSPAAFPKPSKKNCQATKTRSAKAINAPHLAVALLLLAGTCASRAQNFNGSDSLTETTENTTDWKTPDSGVEGGSAFTNTSNGLQYTDSTNTDDNVDRGWKLNLGSYTENWTLQLDLSVSGITLGANGQLVAMGLQVGETGNFGNNSMELNLTQSYESGNSDLNYNDYVTTNGGSVLSAQYSSPQIGSTSGAIEISYNAATQTISTYYDSTGVPGAWTSLGSTSISSGPSDWNMTSSNTFTAALQGYSSDTVVTSGESVYATNFVASSVPEPSTWALLAAGAGVLLLVRRPSKPGLRLRRFCASMFCWPLWEAWE